MLSARNVLYGLLLALIVVPARAEQSEVTIAQQYGVAFLPLMVMERDKLLEKHARAAGLGEVSATWVKVAGPSVMNDGVVSGSIVNKTNGGASTAGANVILVAFGFAVSFVSAWIVVKTFLGYVQRHGFALFAWWRVIVGTLGLIALAIGG